MIVKSAKGAWVALVFALLAGPAAAEPTPRQMELATRYLDLTDADGAIDGVMEAMRPMMMARGSSTKLTPEQQAKLVDLLDETMRSMVRKITPLMAAAVAETFTEKELQDLIAFYEGPTGRALVAKTPQLTKLTMQMVQEMMPGLMAELMARRCEIVDCAAPAAKPNES